MSILPLHEWRLGYGSMPRDSDQLPALYWIDLGFWRISWQGRSW